MRKGLFIGINEYDSSSVSNLGGCVNDAISIATVLSRHGSGTPNFHNELMTTGTHSLGKKQLESKIRELFSGEANVALLYFAGHGYFDSTIDEGTLIPQDFESSGDGIRISDILQWAADSDSIQNKIIILDCCQAGAAAQSRNLRGGASVLGEGVTILTACKKEQSANEVNGHGVFTKLLLQAVQGGAADVLGKITPSGIYSFIDSALGPWEQRPVFKTNVSHFCAMREMPPKVSLDILRQLPTWFPEANSVYPLSPAHEPTEKDVFDPELGKIFSQLQACNRFGLVEPVDAEHMYFAAIESKACRLTALGEYYHQLAEKEAI
ncbi:caspase family protein [Photobacterium swingsii]|uniref:caspase family protein n=1 Tax=Photobacterium swingsii TaxID=680026 RepID=UPI00406930C1